MSGGFFNYDQYRIDQIREELEKLIESNNSIDEYGYARNYPPEIIEKFKEGLLAIKKAYIYAQRIDYLVSGDDGEESFIKRLEEDLSKLMGEYDASNA